jgi:hypothetical protein
MPNFLNSTDHSIRATSTLNVKIDLEMHILTFELVIRPSIQERRRYDVVPRARDRTHCHKLRCLAGRGRNSGSATLERRDPFLENVNGRIANARVDVSKRAQTEEVRGVLRVVEDETGRGVDRRCASVGSRVDVLSRVQL